ncbi:hypothetical protein IDJ77_11630 [Mucilaginibacter sp. ZT4R22]|uniref:Uncharacterized protein n=1 Tax=Mucilaginibacter pankratovii TaxID=2772110 RepID=A0ABR7WQ51_9SPHI|nr:hypothetical protein [Mucilaginibacter pankratovii]MBD1364460.1 hypothetical protein [Mucilaginibacter pankratovii]
MAKEKKKKEPKIRSENYDSKLAINGSFDDVIKASFLGKPAPPTNNGKDAEK